jgi:hypothetical protein
MVGSHSNILKSKVEMVDRGGRMRDEGWRMKDGK